MRAAPCAGCAPGRAALLFILLCALAAPAAGQQADGDKVNEIAKKVAAIHKLALKNPVSHIVLSKEKLIDRIKRLVFIDYTKEEVIDEGRMMVRLGLFPAGVDYGRTVFDLLEEQVIGLYDTEARQLLLVDSLPNLMQDTTVNHEITHAVQDQNFDLYQLMKRREGEGDLKLAISAVFEGDALVMEEFFSGISLPDFASPEEIESVMMMAGDKKSKIYKAPPILRESLFFPYSYGYVFMKKIFNGGGMTALNAVLTSLPQSTEQIMHPDAYFAGDKPEKVSFTVPESIRGAYRVAVEDVMGEFSIKAWLERFMDPYDASVAAAGWEGDWFIFLWPSDKKVGKDFLGRGVFIMVSRWEPGKKGSSPDAGECAAALEKIAEARWKPEKKAPKEGMKIYKNLIGEWIIIRRVGDSVLYVEGLPAHLYTDPEKIAGDLLPDKGP